MQGDTDDEEEGEGVPVDPRPPPSLILPLPQEVLRRIRGAEVDSKEMERGLKWLCLLPQLLLRSARRGGKPGRGNVARRFSCLSMARDWGALLTLWWKDRTLLREEREVGRSRKTGGGPR